MGTLIQYIIITILVIGATYFLYNKFYNSFKGDCSTGGCGCAPKKKSKLK